MPSPNSNFPRRDLVAGLGGLFLAILLSGVAGGLAWGIRGQYGHQTGAMLAGLLVGLVFVTLFGQKATSVSGARSVAFFCLGISLGGSMTYGQTLGLTQDAPLVGNWDAFLWGLLGTSIKGGVWIGLGAFFFSLAAGNRDYRSAELATLIGLALLARFVGIEWLNEPFNPEEKVLPTIYFSDDWYWEPDADLTPRRELWGGLWAALVTLVAYVAVFRRDFLAVRLTMWGCLAGAIGFTLGQCVQSYHAWNRAWFLSGWPSLEPHINWWNMMEISFGGIFGSILAIGVWRNRDSLFQSTVHAESASQESEPEIDGAQETALLLVHCAALIAWSFFAFAQFDFYADMAFTMILIPLVASRAGRYWSYFVLFPIVLLPIAGKTYREVCYRSAEIPADLGCLLLLALPALLTLLWAIHHGRRGDQVGAAPFARASLLLTTWLYFLLNFAFFEFPWPWHDWTARTPSALIMLAAALILTVGSLIHRSPRLPKTS
jgi:hypothetical protein